mmetsp:Transcript_76190/g.172269  ORF Transcript_76190/g.172269 Transcript_76190/m.172269 type:complete len:269 (+) Transcript_76190:37-843(+)
MVDQRRLPHALGSNEGHTLWCRLELRVVHLDDHASTADSARQSLLVEVGAGLFAVRAPARGLDALWKTVHKVEDGLQEAEHLAPVQVELERLPHPGLDGLVFFVRALQTCAAVVVCVVSDKILAVPLPHGLLVGGSDFVKEPGVVHWRATIKPFQTPEFLGHREGLHGLGKTPVVGVLSRCMLEMHAHAGILPPHHSYVVLGPHPVRNQANDDINDLLQHLWVLELHRQGVLHLREALHQAGSNHFLNIRLVSCRLRATATSNHPFRA